VNTWEREAFKQVTAQQAMELLRRRLAKVTDKIGT